MKDLDLHEEEELYPDGSSKYEQRPDTAEAAAAVEQIPNDGSPILTATYVIPGHTDRSAAESESAAAVLSGMFARRRAKQ